MEDTMTTTAASEARDQREPAAEHRSFPIARLDLEEEVRGMRTSPHPGAHLGKTLLRTADMRLVLMILRRGVQISEHRAEGSLTIQPLDGRVIVTLLESTFDLGPGQLLAIEHDVSHAITAAEDSAILLTIAWRGVRRE